MRYAIKLFFILSVSLGLSACGFKLRTPPTFTSALKTMYIQTGTPNDPTVQQLQRVLVANNITLVNKPTVAKSILNILSISNTNTMSNFGGVNVAGFYQASLSVTYNVTTPDGKVLIPTTTLQESQNFTSNATQVLSTSSAAAQLTNVMQEDVVAQIITALASVSGA